MSLPADRSASEYDPSLNAAYSAKLIAASVWCLILPTSDSDEPANISAADEPETTNFTGQA